MPIRTIAIAGAGLSGFAAAVALRDRGFTGAVTLVDAKPRLTNDRTWCWWHVDGIPFAEIADRRWTRCRVAYGDRSGTAASTAHPYLHLSGDAYYTACMARLADTDTTLSLGEPIRAIDDDGDAAVVRTCRRDIRADLVIDARGNRAGASLRQHFSGMRIVVDRPVFDPDTVTLMDFVVAREGIRFVYVLPFSPFEALIEDTAVDGARPDPAEHRRGIDRYLHERYDVTARRVVHCEAGAIALDARRIAPFASPRVLRAGIAAGATRASSGYTYVRAHRHARAIAAFVVAGTALPKAGAFGYAALDAIAVHAVRKGTVDVPRLLAHTFAHASGDALARFMSDAARTSDLVDVVRAIAGGLPAAILGASLLAHA